METKTAIDVEELFILQLHYMKQCNFPAELVAKLKSKKEEVLAFAKTLPEDTAIPFIPAISKRSLEWTKIMAHYIFNSSHDHSLFYSFMNGFAYNEERMYSSNTYLEPYFMMNVQLLEPADVAIETTTVDFLGEIEKALAAKEMVGMNYTEAINFVFQAEKQQLLKEYHVQYATVGTSWESFECPTIYRGRDYPFVIDTGINLSLNEGKIAIKGRHDLPIKIPVYQKAI